MSGSVLGRKERTKHLPSFILIAFLAIATIAVGSKIQEAGANNTVRILSDGSISPPYAPITRINKTVYTLTANVPDSISVERSNILIQGAGYTVTGDGTGNGFTLISVHNVTIENTIIWNFTYGIYAETSSSINIRNNSLTSNAYDGIGIFYSTFTSVHDNTIVRNEYDGIEVYNSSNNNIYGNYIAENVWYGMGLYEYSTANITRNRIVGNYGGIELSLSSNNAIFHNDFINQTIQASTEFSTAKWDNDYPSGGNYWNDYIGSDVYSGPNQDQFGSDGIGDTPYNCSEDNQDRYPLMQVFTNIAVQRVLPSKSIVGQGYNVSIEVRVENQGWEPKTASITFYVNTTVIATYTNLAMTGRNQTILNATWQTATYTRGNYTTRIVADTVSGETDIADNNCTWIIHVGVPGDVSGSTQGVYDGMVNMRDIQYMILLFNAKPGSIKWNPNADVNSDLVVNMRDINIAILNFNKHE